MVKIAHSKIELFILSIFGLVILMIGFLEEDLIKSTYGIIGLVFIYILVWKEIMYDENGLIIKFKYNFFIKDKYFKWEEIQGLKTGADGQLFMELSNGENYKFTSIGFNTAELEKVIVSKTV